MSAAAGKNKARPVLPASPDCTAIPAAQRPPLAIQFVVLPVLVFGLAEALSAVFSVFLGVSVLRTLPQGSVGALASGIFFNVSW